MFTISSVISILRLCSSYFKITISFLSFWLCWVFIALHGHSLVTATGGSSLVTVRGLLIATASLFAELRLLDMRASLVLAPRLQSADSVIVALRLSCSVACGMFPD